MFFREKESCKKCGTLCPICKENYCFNDNLCFYCKSLSCLECQSECDECSALLCKNCEEEGCHRGWEEECCFDDCNYFCQSCI